MAAKRKESARYFSHDSNARNSDKLIRLRMRHGAAGYGVFFMILERLRDEDDYMSVKDYNMIAFDLRVDASLIKSVVEDFGLFAFTEDGKCFYSESFSQRMAVKDEKSSKARESASSKWNTSDSHAATRSERLAIARTKGTHSKEEWEELKDFFGHCVICGASSDEAKLVKDHIVPIYQGGSDGIDNLQPLCQSCNSRKGPDSTDYRLVYCEQNGLKMPAKWLRNACETPANKNKIKENKKKSPDGDKEKPPSSPPSSFEDFLAEALNSPIWLEAIAKNLQSDIEAVCTLLKGDFHDHCIREDKRHHDISDFKSHFNRWVSQRKYSSQNETRNPRNNSGRPASGLAAKLPVTPDCGIKRRPNPTG
ncbi:MAG: DUF4373 domain-containing protein [Muribaculaceae bacterium]|nr:DUF4373 domain-containing protein [Muribaculaceae bacterium]